MKHIALGEICRVVSGATPRREKMEYWNGDIPWVTPKEISSLKSTYLEDSVEKITAAGFKSCSTGMLPPGSLLLSSRAPIGLLAINKVSVCTNQGFKSLVPSKDVNVLFLYYTLKNRLNQLQAKGKGATFKELSKADVERFIVPCPPIDDQIRIATLLSRVEALIATRKENLRLLDEFLKSTFLEMFGDPVRNDRGWPTAPLSKIGRFVSGGTPSKKRDDFWNGEFPWVSPKDMKVSCISDAQDHISESVFKETALKRIPPGHLLIVVRGMILAHSFPLAINTVAVSINQDMKAILPNKENDVHYLMACLDGMKRQILGQISSAGHGTKRFDALAMNKILVPIPPNDHQRSFAQVINRVDHLKNLYQQSLTELENLYGALSQKAFKGELDLSRIPLEKEFEPQMDANGRESESESEKPSFAHLDQGAMSDPVAREKVLRQIFEEYFNKHPSRSFSFNEFWDRVERNVLDHMDEESPPIGVADYDLVKRWLFEWLKESQIEQHFNTSENQMELRPKS